MKVQAQTLLGIIVVCDNDDTVATDTRGGEVDRRQLAILRIGLDWMEIITTAVLQIVLRTLTMKRVCRINYSCAYTWKIRLGRSSKP